MNFGIENKTALVIGGSKGLGFASAKALVSEGVNVIIASRNQASLDEAEAALKTSCVNAKQWVATQSLDLASADLSADLNQIKNKHNDISILINNCGGPAPKAISTVTMDEWQTYFSSMALSMFKITTTFLPAMRENNWGRIINIVSSGVVEPIPVLGISNAIRASIIAFSKTLATEVAADGVTVNSLAPGRIATSRLKELDKFAAEKTNVTVDAVQKELLKAIPIGRYGDPDEFGAMAAFLASQQASYITGSIHRIDGGLCRSL